MDTFTDNQLEEDLVPKEIDRAGDGKQEEQTSASTSIVHYDPFQRYMAEIRRFPLLSKEEEFRLGVQYKKEGDLEAAHGLVTSHLQLVIKIAFLFRRVYHNMMDLVQEGNIGLMQAVKHFDPYLGVRLSTYASWWIRAYILKFILDNWRLVKVGTTNARRKLLYNLQKEKEKLDAQGFNYSPKLLAERLDVKEEDIIEVEKSLSAGDISLDATIDDQSKKTFADMLFSPEPPIEERLEDKEFEALFREKIQTFAEGLKEKDRYILNHRLVAEEPITLQEIGDKFGITREAIRQKEKKLRNRLKTYLTQELPDYIDVDLLDNKTTERK
jgi:RNA polymerase sigma-32 factor